MCNFESETILLVYVVDQFIVVFPVQQIVYLQTGVAAIGHR